MARFAASQARDCRCRTARLGSSRFPGIPLADPSTMRLRLTTALLALTIGAVPALRAGLCAPGGAAEPHRHSHADGGIDHQHPSSYTTAHSHIQPASEMGGPSGGSESDAGIPCCRSASGSTTVSVSLESDARPKLLASAVVGSARDLPTPRATSDLQSLFRDEQRSPFVHTRAPLLI